MAVGFALGAMAEFVHPNLSLVNNPSPKVLAEKPTSTAVAKTPALLFSCAFPPWYLKEYSETGLA